MSVISLAEFEMLPVLLSMAVILIWLFFAGHAMQFVDSPVDRLYWLLFFVFLFWVAPVVYYFSRYRKLAHSGKAWLTFREHEGRQF